MLSVGRPVQAVAAALTWLAFHTGGGTMTVPLVERLERAATRPLPAVAPRAVPTPADVWVPDRWVPSPEGTLLVPGHWERRTGEREFWVPPLTVCSRTGDCRLEPAGVRGPADSRTTP